MSIPFSPPTFSAPALPSMELNQVCATWGTAVNIAETMKLFQDFLRGFKPNPIDTDDVEKSILLQLEILVRVFLKFFSMFTISHPNPMAYVTRDPDSKQLVLESGALVLSDGGVRCIDEIRQNAKWNSQCITEQQTVSIAKAGIITTLDARTPIVAAANPVESRYNVNVPVDETLDLELARHLVGLYLEDAPLIRSEYDILPLEDLAAYMDYSRKHINPVHESLCDSSSMIHLSEAHARMRFATHVEAQDVQEACRLMREANRTSATDPRTGEIDMGLFTTGTGTGQRKLRDDMRKEILAILEGSGGKGKGRLGSSFGHCIQHIRSRWEPASQSTPQALARLIFRCWNMLCRQKWQVTHGQFIEVLREWLKEFADEEDNYGYPFDD
ncbi:MCM2/3/5 family-domain-containing protein [Pisolithus albus]|nr:MCM2/3/5 family-domain-containing protein [Pisolithus albus]